MDPLLEDKERLHPIFSPLSQDDLETSASPLFALDLPAMTNGHTNGYKNGNGHSAGIAEALPIIGSDLAASPSGATLPAPPDSIAASEHTDHSARAVKKELNKAAGNAGFVGAGNVASFFFRYGNNFLIQRGLGAGSYGLYAFSMSVISLISSIFVLGLNNAMLRYTAIYNSRKQASLLRGLTIFCTFVTGLASLIGAVALLFYAPNLGAFLNRRGMVPVLELLVPVIPLLTMQTIWMNGLQGFKEFRKRILIVRIYVPGATFLLLLVTLIFFRNLYGFVYATLITTILSTLFSLYFLVQKIVPMESTGPKHQEYAVREWVLYALPNILTSVVEIVNASADTLLLAYFGISFVAIGQYSASIKITSFIGVPLATLTSIFAPTIAELYSNGEVKQLDALFKIMTKWTITFSLPLFCISCIFATSLLGLSGASFIPAWPLLIAFAIGAVINTATGSVGTMLLMTGHQKLSFLNSLAAIITNFVLGFILTPIYGAMGVAISTGLALAVLNLARLIQVVIFVKMQPYSWDMLKSVAASIITSAITGGLLYLLALSGFYIKIGHFHISIELALIPVFCVIYIYVLSLFKFSPEDRIIIDKLNKKFKLGKLRKRLRLAS